MNITIKFSIAALLLATLSACDQPAQQGRAIASLSGPAIQRYHDPGLLALGEQVYQQHCANCHGAQGEGDADWRTRDGDGMFPPPPLNGSGHAWHHPRDWLRQMIMQGSAAGQGKMPAWQGRLSEQEVEAVIEWFMSQWPDRAYAAWYDMQQRSRGR